MTQILLEAQLALFKAHLHFKQASPKTASVIKEMASELGKLTKRQQEASVEHKRPVNVIDGVRTKTVSSSCRCNVHKKANAKTA